MNIESFTGDYRWLSNFWPVCVVLDGIVYPSVENAYQAAKTSPEYRGQFVYCTAGQSKRLGRKVPCRADWDNVKVSIMRELLQQKFKPGLLLAARLVETGSATLIEGNTWGDTFWGVCNGVGHNTLGNLLMQKREKLKE
jgi:ribA/ribD-fused uncharacterized protein